jgi:hypothetical protein
MTKCVLRWWKIDREDVRCAGEGMERQDEMHDS